MILKLPFFICRYPVFAKYSTNLSRALKKKKKSLQEKKKKSPYPLYSESLLMDLKPYLEGLQSSPKWING